jgi:hypothetical protein
MTKSATALLTAALAAMLVQTASAVVPPEAVAIGPVAPGMTEAALVAACGQPLQKAGDKWFYQDFRVEFDDDRPGIVEEVKTTSAAVATPAGVRVGQPVSALEAAYGAPDKLDRDDDSTDEYEYFTADRRLKLEAEVLKGAGTIAEITCKQDD